MPIVLFALVPGRLQEGKAFLHRLLLEVGGLGGEGVSDPRQLCEERRDPGMLRGGRLGHGGAARLGRSMRGQRRAFCE